MTSIARPRPSGLRAIFEYVFHKASTLLGPVAHFCRTSFSWKPMNWHKSGPLRKCNPCTAFLLMIGREVCISNRNPYNLGIQ
ncbi:uncharacterized protein LACBIDRAFT_309826 [Laccaria bicolor S238N-H82]|uniref:Predicted protein n=1 Tax=Laccaria bicolor (strain S238N-H82 / ATCC MYA-4686) TaxID=486041 RepID=B0DT54_LACBS|nr:uncharacterized protein LACBIDRAFT_309826 [Laccaria bicolor S238N-H82]EDR02217.1 predicted protein [Laccaria bicolor S238N-H82]|eukprot:XP_001887162.1 predicted protein [Laccaria bicolor S238N-H82]